MLFTNQSVSGIVTCGDKQSQFLFSGFQLENIDPGCVLSVKGVTFVSAFYLRLKKSRWLLISKEMLPLQLT